MMAGLIDAADKAAAACDHVQSIVVGLRSNGFVVMGRIETPLIGYSHELAVPYATVSLEPSALIFAVERMALVLEERREEVGATIIMPRANEEQPAVRVIERSDWSFWDRAVRAVAVLAVMICVPLAGGLFG